MSQTSSRRQLIGKSILITMLLVSFFSLLYVMWNMERNGFVDEFSFVWTAAVALVLLFPVMAAHIHAMWLSRKIGWLSWWFGVTLASLALFWVFNQMRAGEQTYYNEDEVVSWFFSGCVGGTFGSLVVLGLMRRFAPSWLSYQKPELATEKKKLTLQTMFLWVTAVGFICGAFVNRELLGLIDKHEFHPAFWVPAGAFFLALFCLFIFPVVTNWLNRAKPFWMAGFSLIVFCTLMPLGLAVWISIASGFYGQESSLVSITYTTFFACTSFYAVLWIAACRWAGLIHEPVSNAKSVGIRGFVGRSFGRVGWTLKYVGVTVGALCFLYTMGWLVLHMSGGPERNPRLIHDSIVASLGGTEEDEDWIDIVNRQASTGITKDENVVVKLLVVLNPLVAVPTPLVAVTTPEELEYRKEASLPLFGKLHSAVARFAKELGFSEQEFIDLPVVRREAWLSNRHEAYRKELMEKYSFLEGDEEGYYLSDKEKMASDEDEEDLERVQDMVDEDGNDLEDMATDAKEADDSTGLSRDEILAEYFAYQYGSPVPNLISAPWNESDYPVGAEFLKLHQSKIQKIREISKGTSYYSPLVRGRRGEVNQFESMLMEPIFYLLEASAYFNAGSNRIDEAIEDCKAISRLVKLRNTASDPRGSIYPQRVATELAKTIAYSEFATAEQIQFLLELVQSEEGVETRMHSDKRVFAARVKDELRLCFSGTPEELEANRRFLRNSLSHGPILSSYQSYPGLVNWESLNAELDRNIAYALETSRLASTGEITLQECQERTWETCCVVYPSGRVSSKRIDYSIFGKQFLAFAASPKVKGKSLAWLAVHNLRFGFGGVYNIRTREALDELGLAIRLFEKSKGAYPKSLEALVPNYLRELPLDPFSDEGFVYKSDGKTFLLYSVGENQMDDGGDPLLNGDDIAFRLPCSDLLDYIEREDDY